MGVTSTAIRLTPLRADHSASTLKWMNDSDLMKWLHRDHIISPEEHAVWFRGLEGDATSCYYAIEALPSHLHVGNIWMVNIDSRNKKAEVRVMIGSDHNLGVGSAAIALLADKVFEELGLHRLYAYVLDYNPRAKRAFEKAGFRQEGLLKEDRKCTDRYSDCYLMARLRHET